MGDVGNHIAAGLQESACHEPLTYSIIYKNQINTKEVLTWQRVGILGYGNLGRCGMRG